MTKSNLKNISVAILSGAKDRIVDSDSSSRYPSLRSGLHRVEEYLYF